ncbi:MAG: hypothetical protein J1E00_02330 [Oscillospiraceae bacterium]|nr:hypothetical protein [Oscillospiraceae bacterium]
MGKRLQYRDLLKNWMQFYSITAETAKKMFASIWARTQAAKEKTSEKGADRNEDRMGATDRKSES